MPFAQRRGTHIRHDSTGVPRYCLDDTTGSTIFGGNTITIWTAYDSFEWILILLDPSGRLTRQRLRLSRFHFNVVYEAEIKYQAADALSKIQTDGKETMDLDHGLPSSSVTVPQLLDGKVSHGQMCRDCSVNDDTTTVQTWTPSKRKRRF